MFNCDFPCSGRQAAIEAGEVGRRFDDEQDAENEPELSEEEMADQDAADEAAWNALSVQEQADHRFAHQMKMERAVRDARRAREIRERLDAADRAAGRPTYSAEENSAWLASLRGTP